MSLSNTIAAAFWIVAASSMLALVLHRLPVCLRMAWVAGVKVVCTLQLVHRH